MRTIKIYKRENNEMVEMGSATTAHLAISNVCARLGVQPKDLQIDIKAVSLARTRMDIYFTNQKITKCQPIAQLIYYV